MKKIVTILIIATLIYSCQKTDENLPKSCFDYSNLPNLKSGDTIKFYNYSENSLQFQWDFGDGSSSNEMTPSHVYSNPGEYTIKLTASNGNNRDTFSKSIIIQLNTFIDKIQNLKDTTIVPNLSAYGVKTYGVYDIDIDFDHIVDLSFNVLIYSLGRSTTYSSSVKSNNGYKVALAKCNRYTTTTDDYRTTKTIEMVDMPKIFSLGDTITGNENYTNNSLDFAFCDVSSYATSHSTSANNDWKDLGDKYIVFSNSDKNIFGWVKLNVLDFKKIQLKSCKYFSKSSNMTIQDNN